MTYKEPTHPQLQPTSAYDLRKKTRQKDSEETGGAGMLISPDMSTSRLEFIQQKEDTGGSSLRCLRVSKLCA